MIGVNRIGADGNGLANEKTTLIAAPDGALLERVLAGEEMDIYDIDSEQVLHYRTESPMV
jgi:hypothetical protein